MKKTLLWLISSLLLLASYSCENNSYAHKRELEKKAMENYITANNLEVSEDWDYCSKRPYPWPENLYFKTPQGVYLHIVADTTSTRKAEKGNTLIFRFINQTLAGDFLYDNLDPDVDREGYKFVYDPDAIPAKPSIAWVDIVPYIHHRAQFIMIIDSKLGTPEQQQRVETWKVTVKETTISN